MSPRWPGMLEKVDEDDKGRLWPQVVILLDVSSSDATGDISGKSEAE